MELLPPETEATTEKVKLEVVSDQDKEDASAQSDPAS